MPADTVKNTPAFLPTEDGEFNGNAPMDDNMPIAATDDRDVDWVDVTGWGVFKGHAIPVDVARHIAEKINLYRAFRKEEVTLNTVNEGGTNDENLEKVCRDVPKKQNIGAPVLRVKALEWVDKSIALMEYHADCDDDGRWRYSVSGKDGTYALKRYGVECGSYPSIDSAQAAAQADHESRVLSLIDADHDQSRRAPDPVRDKLVEALEGLVALNNDHSPFGGEFYQDRLDRAWDRARAALSLAKGEKA